MDERKKREADPTLALLRDCVADASRAGGQSDKYTRERLTDMLDFFEQMTSWYEQTRRIPTPTVMKMTKMGDKVAKLLGVM
jgi:DNA-binding transcriptional regulator GbsR (MarR family)